MKDALFAPGIIGGVPDRLVHARELIQRAIAERIFPGAVVLVSRGGRVGWLEATGYAEVFPRRRSMDVGMLFDIASLTKVVCALPVTLWLVQAGVVELELPVREVLPEFSGAGRERVRVYHLLAHTSGLPAWRPLYLHVPSRPTRESVLRALCAVPLEREPGSQVVYSDLGILVVGILAERLTGERIDTLFRRHVGEPLGLRETGFCPQGPLRERCVATEAGNGYERAMAGPAGEGFRWRTHVLVGEVHDGNAHYALGSVAAHAGLFSTASEVARVAGAWLRPHGWIDPAVVAESLRDQRRGAGGPRWGLGWRLRDEDAFFAAFGPYAFGHTGFTGTSVVVDPAEELVVVLLTNRVHPGVDERVEAFRGVFHTAVRSAIG